MGVAETASLIVNLQLKGGFAGALNKQAKALNTFDSRLKTSESRAYHAGQQIGTGIRRGAALAAGGLAFLAGNVAIGLNSLVDLEQATAQTEAVLKSTKSVAGQTADSIRALAEKYEGLNATIDDRVIQSGENLLLTFTNVRKQAFEPALAAALDLSTALHTDLDSAIKTVGKALSEPEKATARLRRAGIVLTKAEEKQIKAHLKNNDALGAQNVILAALTKRYGGSFAKQGQTTAGRIAKFKDSIEDLQRALAKALLPTLGNVADELTKFLADPKVIKGVEDLGKQIAGVFSKENLGNAGRVLGDIFNAAKEAAPGIIAAAKTAGAVIGTAVKLFQSLPPEIQRLAIGGAAINKLTGGLVTNIAGGLIGAVLKQLVSGVVNVNGAVVNVNGGIGGGGGVPGAVGAGAAGAAGVGTGLALGTITAAVATTVASTIPFAIRNNELGSKGLNAAEIAAVKYYSASTTEQQTIAKRLGSIPSKADWLSGLNKLTAQPGKQKDDLGGRTAAQLNAAARALAKGLTLVRPSTEANPGKMKDDLVVPLTGKLDTVQSTLAGKLADDTVAVNATKDKIGTTSVAIQATTRSATLTGANIAASATRSGSAAIVAAIWAARPVVNVTNVTRMTTIQSRYGPPTGSAGNNAGSQPPGHTP